MNCDVQRVGPDCGLGPTEIDLFGLPNGFGPDNVEQELTGDIDGYNLLEARLKKKQHVTEMDVEEGLELQGLIEGENGEHNSLNPSPVEPVSSGPSCKEKGFGTFRAEGDQGVKTRSQRALLHYIPNFALNNLAAFVGLSLGNPEEERNRMINEMLKRASVRVTSSSKTKKASKSGSFKRIG